MSVVDHLIIYWKAKATDGKLKDLKKARQAHQKAADKVAMLLSKQTALLSTNTKGNKGKEAVAIKGLMSAMNAGQAKLKAGTSRAMTMGTNFEKTIGANRKIAEKKLKVCDKKQGKKL